MILASLWPSRNGRPLIEDLGFLVHESEEEYRAKAQQCLDGEQLGDFSQDAFLFHKRQRGLVPPAVCSGNHLDSAILARMTRGEDAYRAEFAIGGPIDPRTGKPYSQYATEFQKWAAQQCKPVLTVDEAALVDHVDFGFRAHRAAKELLSVGVADGIVRTRYCGMLCQARLDWVNAKRGIVAAMTCDRLDYVASHVRCSWPANEFAFQRALLAQVIGRHVPVHLIAVEKREPHRCGVWDISERLLRRAQKDNEKALARLRECRRLDRWPTGYEQVRKLAPIGI